MLDIIVISLVIVLGLKGIFNGLIKELFGLIGIVGGIFTASRFCNEVGAALKTFAPFIESGTATCLAGFSVTFLAFWLASYMAGMLLKKILKLSGLGLLDAAAGAIFGAFKIFFIFGIIAYAIEHVGFLNMASLAKGSKVYPLLHKTGAFIMSLDNDGKIKQKAMDGAKELQEKMETSDVSDEEMQELKNKAKDLSVKDLEQMIKLKQRESNENDER